MRSFLPIILVISFLLSVWPVAGQAQSLAGVLSNEGTQAEAPSIEDIIERAAENGVSHVVIDNAGNLLAQIEDAPAELVAQSEGSALMRM